MAYGPVSMREETLVIPTYPVGAADRNPMFLEKRVYQGSSGKVYPLPTIESISDEKVDREYRAVVLENDFLLVVILPELGGRIQRALDKTNNYDFVYHNRVIKPALVGLAGPWISGGIEFNWPQHHRPTTFMPVSHELRENADGSKTVWVGEIDRMHGTKGMAGFTLHPDRAYIEIAGRLYNGTQSNQSFLWWANPAVAVNDDTRSIFPGDVHAVFDHGKRDVSKFPVATGVYYKHDYSAGVDIARYRNVPVPTSYMAYRSDFDFVGGYDYGMAAGILHVADRQVAPGKKQWTWGCGDFGKAWDRNLTDADGPYIELMTGVYTDNQPDFTWLKPGETKTFKQYFLPYKRLGQVADATADCLVSFDLEGGRAVCGLYASVEPKGWRVTLHRDGAAAPLLDAVSAPRPAEAKVWELPVPAGARREEFRLRVLDAAGRAIIDYRPEKPADLKLPDPAKRAPEPADVATNEELYLTGIHLEQYRHATYAPEAYYLEGLKRDPGDMRINCAYGDLLLRRGLFAEAERHFRRAVERSRLHNANPRDGEALYGLGLAFKHLGRCDEAKTALFRATWDGAYRDSGYLGLARLALLAGNAAEALEHADAALMKNWSCLHIRLAKCIALRRLGREPEAAELARGTILLDPLDFAARSELRLCLRHGGSTEAPRAERDLDRLLAGEAHNHISLAAMYEDCGAWMEAADVLEHFLASGADHPEVRYHLAYCLDRLGKANEAARMFAAAEKADSAYCFPNKLASLAALQRATEILPSAPKARYYLGCLYYDARRHDDAAREWERSAAEDGSFPTVHRNLALYYHNKAKDAGRALVSLQRAFSLDPADARVFFELDQLRKKLGAPHRERLDTLAARRNLVDRRDDLFTEFVALHNNLGRHAEALSLLAGRKFHPWEGGEGKVTGQYVLALTELAKQALASNDPAGALALLDRARNYPENLGEGKLEGAAENGLDYLSGLAKERLGDGAGAAEWYRRAARGISEPAGAMFYNDQPADSIFFQGLALARLGDAAAARGRFHKLFDYGEKHLFDAVRIDYFAVSLPDFLVFDDDLTAGNEAHCRYLMGLGLIGLGERGAGEVHIRRALELRPNHQGMLFAWKNL